MTVRNSLFPTIIVGFLACGLLLAPRNALTLFPGPRSGLAAKARVRQLVQPEAGSARALPSQVTSSPPDNFSRLRKALFGNGLSRHSQTRIVLNLLLHFLIMTMALLICLFGIRILHYLPLFLFFFSIYYAGLLLNRFGGFHNLSDPLLNLGWTFISFLVAYALFVPLRRKEQTLALNLGVCLTVVIICIIGLYVFRLESRRAAIGSLLASAMMGTAFTVLGLHDLDSLLIFGSSLIGSLSFITSLQIALEDQSMLTPDDPSLVYFVESPLMYFLSVLLLFGAGLATQKLQEKQQLQEMENSIAEIRNNITLD